MIALILVLMFAATTVSSCGFVRSTGHGLSNAASH
jgi:hypothetical protein